MLIAEPEVLDLGCWTWVAEARVRKLSLTFRNLLPLLVLKQHLMASG